MPGMRTIFSSLFAFYIFLFPFNNKQESYDVCVYGGTSAGVIAAYSAAQLGKKVVLIEPGTHLGGLTSGGLGYTDIGNKYAITGLSRDFYRQIGKHYGKFEQWTFEPHVAENLFNKYVQHKNITVLLDRRLDSTYTTDKTITHIDVVSSKDGSGTSRVKAKVFIDCSYEGDLMAGAGVSFTIGRESNSAFNETYNGVQLMEGHQFPDGIDPYKHAGDRSSGLLWGIDTATLEPNGTGDSSIQAYNYRICLTDDPRNRRDIERPANYDSTRYELLLRLINAQPGKRKLNDYFIVSRMPNNKTDINNRGGFSSDMIGFNHTYPYASYAERKNIIRAHEDYTKGLLYFIGHDNKVPEQLRNEMLKWGYPKDEYTDNNNWSPQLYIRESRRMRGAYVMTQHNCEGREVVSDTVGLAAYTMDSHNCRRLVVNEMVKNEGNVEVGGFGPYPISYRAIIPRKEECTNLYVPVCLSATHIAYGSIRMEPVFMVLAQSAGVAASMAIDKQVPVQEVDIRILQHHLRKDPLLNGSVPDVLVDNDNTALITANGKWERFTSEPSMGYTGNYGPSMLVAAQVQGKETYATFKPVITTAGRYRVFYYLPKIAGASSKTKIVVDNGRIKKDIWVNSGNVVVEGQTSGEWAELGIHQFLKGDLSTITATGEGANGTIVADAVLLVHVK